MDQFDALIIGTGQAGKPLAHKLAHEGLRTLIIEKDKAGGSCINWGCTPTKMMVAAAQRRHFAENSAEMGIITGKTTVDFEQLRVWRDSLVEEWRDGIVRGMVDQDKLDILFGEAYFCGPNEIEVRLADGKGTKQFKADKIFINVGTSPAIPPIEGMEHVPYFTSKSMMELKEIPEHLLVLGGGYIGLEFGQVYQRLGSQVSIVQQDKQLVGREDEDIATALHKVLEAEGMRIYLNAKAQAVSQEQDRISLQLADGQSIRGSHLLVATGTQPNTKILQLEKAGVETDKRGYIQVNEHLQTSAQGVFALGDCKGGPEFTHISYDDYRVVSNYLFGDKKRSAKDRMLPYTLFTQPELGRIGLSEKQARQQGINYKIASISMEHVARAIESRQTAGFLKVLVDGESGQLLGAACLAAAGGEIMGMLQIAMMGRLDYRQLEEGIYSHPTYAELFNNLFSDLQEPE